MFIHPHKTFFKAVYTYSIRLHWTSLTFYNSRWHIYSPLHVWEKVAPQVVDESRWKWTEKREKWFHLQEGLLLKNSTTYTSKCLHHDIPVQSNSKDYFLSPNISITLVSALIAKESFWTKMYFKSRDQSRDKS